MFGYFMKDQEETIKQLIVQIKVIHLDVIITIIRAKASEFLHEVIIYWYVIVGHKILKNSVSAFFCGSRFLVYCDSYPNCCFWRDYQVAFGKDKTYPNQTLSKPGSAWKRHQYIFVIENAPPTFKEWFQIILSWTCLHRVC